MTTSDQRLPQIYATFEDAARSFRCSKKTISRKVKAGELEARGEGRGRKITIASIRRHPDYPREDGDDAST